MEGVRNLNVDVAEENGDVVFLHKIVEGSASRSYGIHVAKLAGAPRACWSVRRSTFTIWKAAEHVQMLWCCEPDAPQALCRSKHGEHGRSFLQRKAMHGQRRSTFAESFVHKGTVSEASSAAFHVFASGSLGPVTQQAAQSRSDGHDAVRRHCRILEELKEISIRVYYDSCIGQTASPTRSRPGRSSTGRCPSSRSSWRIPLDAGADQHHGGDPKRRKVLHTAVTDNGSGIEAGAMVEIGIQTARHQQDMAADRDLRRHRHARLSAGRRSPASARWRRVELITQDALMPGQGRRSVVRRKSRSWQTTAIRLSGRHDGDRAGPVLQRSGHGSKFLASDSAEYRDGIVDMVSQDRTRIRRCADLTLINGKQDRVRHTRQRQHLRRHRQRYTAAISGRDLLPVERQPAEISSSEGSCPPPSAVASSVESRADLLRQRQSRIQQSAWKRGSGGRLQRRSCFAGRFPVAFLFLSLSSPEKLGRQHPSDEKRDPLRRRFRGRGLRANECFESAPRKGIFASDKGREPEKPGEHRRGADRKSL